MKKYFFTLFATGFISFSCANAQIINTIAGNGSEIYAADGISALLSGMWPHEVQVDFSGNIYFADRANNCIRKIDTSGIITTVVGTTIGGFSGDGGPATEAEIYDPTSIIFDKVGNMYISDAVNSRIRKVDTANIITTIAGNGLIGYSGDGGPALDAEMNGPYGLALDALGNVYFADSYNNAIRKINSSGIITTVVGNGTAGFSGDDSAATNAELSWPTSIIFDDLRNTDNLVGNLYIADASNNRIRKVSPDGIITTIAGAGTYGTIPGATTGSYSGDGVSAVTATLNAPTNLAIDKSGNIYISDNGNSRIRMINSAGTISTVCGNGTQGFSGDGGMATAAEIDQPLGLAVTNNGNLIFCDGGNNRLREILFDTTTATGINTVSVLSKDIIVYPNPSNTIFIIQSPVSVNISVANMLGEVVLKKDNAKQINLNDMPSGIYLLSVFDVAGTVIKTERLSWIKD